MSEPVLAGFSHGTSSPVGQRLVSELMDAVAAELPEGASRLGFVDVQQPDIRATFDSVDTAAPIVVVPLLLSAGYHVHVDLRRAVDEQPDRATALTGALGPDERLTAVLVRRLDEAGLRPEDALVLSVAGSSDRRAIADCEVVAGQLAAATGHEVTLGYLSAAEPRLEDAVRTARSTGRRVVVSSYLLAPGYFHDLAVAGGGDVTSAPLLAAHDEPPRELVDVVLDRYAEGAFAL
ncbi:MAG: CbiX/SirB N-terminal domain-containing protein [Pseudolysinimonas sp.]